MAFPAPTADQKQKLIDDHAAHRAWLRDNKINEQPHALTEDSFTGLILAGLLDPDSAPSVCRALFVSLNPSSRVDVVLPLSAYCPSSGVDLVVEAQQQDFRGLVVVEHKRFTSPSHAPGYKKNPNARWQTDQVYEAATSDYWPRWMHETDPSLPVAFVVLDGYGKPMEQLFPGGLHNEKWAVTSYSQFGAVLRAEHDRGVRGLIPLLAALYAGAPRA
ncbi:hypothetical protein CP973_21260 [Streptomyces albofaciens JCM 4342]|uniref:hypothetical protein n=1 Tax=Streptomyces albofaciens TaxID=66866 RepID=UPI000AE64064|nr:hypothetical protein [Streptomyces albofaciens]KAA6212026.1 hypothetical protein CP973_21260 [Streptomyces albofaciens JCM 4342]